MSKARKPQNTTNEWCGLTPRRSGNGISRVFMDTYEQGLLWLERENQNGSEWCALRRNPAYSPPMIDEPREER